MTPRLKMENSNGVFPQNTSHSIIIVQIWDRFQAENFRQGLCRASEVVVSARQAADRNVMGKGQVCNYWCCHLL